MRPIRLSPALAAAVTAMALAPTSASAAGALARLHPIRHIGPGGCHVTIAEEPPRIASGEQVTLFGQLVCPGGGSAVSGQTVTAYQRIAKTVGFKSVATATTVEHGFYEITVPSITADSLFYTEALGARSGVRHVRVAPTVTLSGPSQMALRTGFRNRVTFSGKVAPADEGASLALQREFAAGSEEYKYIQGGIVGPGGAYSITHTFAIPGVANLRVVVLPHAFYVAGISETLSYTVSQTQNPRLTINPSAYQIPYGQPLTIKGVLAGGANQQVTLFSHPRLDPRFTEVTKTTTNGSDEYTFTIASDIANAVYKVTSSSVSSAEVWTGVPYTLTAGVSATTVQAGQSVTFSGMVTPARVGHVVYLERENALGVHGFHVVNVGTVASNGTYSITRNPWGRGKQVYRVRIPGDPENQGASSGTFTIEVTPGNPLALRPVKEGKLPSEGQL